MQVYTVDARNHGESPHTHDMSYDLMSTDLVQFCQSHDLKKVVLMGKCFKTNIILSINYV